MILKSFYYKRKNKDIVIITGYPSGYKKPGVSNFSTMNNMNNNMLSINEIVADWKPFNTRDFNTPITAIKQNPVNSNAPPLVHHKKNYSIISTYTSPTSPTCAKKLLFDNVPFTSSFQ